VYCWQVQGQAIGKYKPTKMIPANQWIEAFNRIRPSQIAISGGEPFLQPGLIDILEQVETDVIGLTSNLSDSKLLIEFCRRISSSKVRYITASYHPTENRMSKDALIGKVLLLKEHGFQTTVNIVAWPELLWLIPSLHSEFASHGIAMHVEPYASMSSLEVNYTERQTVLLKQFVAAERAFINVDNVLCSGGVTHLSVQPDGSAWRCTLEQQQGINQVGNIFDEKFQLNQNWADCNQAKKCPGCDRDKVQVVSLS
jgi:MoaA/NifB/PqqE/SkfB family radical SAM enzyme